MTATAPPDRARSTGNEPPTARRGPALTLRLRLVLATTLLVTAGLGLFGTVTYALFASGQYGQLDTQLRNSVSGVERLLEYRAGIAATPPPGDVASVGASRLPPRGRSASGPSPAPGPDHERGSPPQPVPPGTYAELRTPTGSTASVQLLSSGPAPELPATLRAPDGGGISYLTVGSTSGTGHYRVGVTADGDVPGATLVLAVPTTAVRAALRRLVELEVVGGAALLVALTAGLMLLLRRGLRPLEQVAVTARSITADQAHPGALVASDFDRRVSEDGPSEVGQVGAAINTLLADVQVALAEREATEARLRQFLADASHELRTPLTSIRGFAELFRLNPDRVELATILRRIEEESGRMGGLVDDLLTLARLDAPRSPVRGAVDVAVIAADACSDAIAAAPDRHVTLEAPTPVVVSADAAMVRQAVANLVANALKHTPAGTPLEVGARVGDRRAVVTVRDHGPGLSAEGLAHAFDRFWQADRARVGTGAGLGLAIVAGIAAQHGGRATVRNADGGGAEFSLVLPISPAGAGATAAG
ncbi:MAG TPA: ATP-binding protein [Acidimicrobiales bacterium]|nr:ATP-binding protein [Acidimicrobiales bacterium]